MAIAGDYDVSRLKRSTGDFIFVFISEKTDLNGFGSWDLCSSIKVLGRPKCPFQSSLICWVSLFSRLKRHPEYTKLAPAYGALFE